MSGILLTFIGCVFGAYLAGLLVYVMVALYAYFQKKRQSGDSNR